MKTTVNIEGTFNNLNQVRLVSAVVLNVTLEGENSTTGAAGRSKWQHLPFVVVGSSCLCRSLQINRSTGLSAGCRWMQWNICSLLTATEC